MWWILIGLAVVVFTSFKLIRSNKYWLNKGIRQSNPVPLFGDSFGTVSRTQSFTEFFLEIYNKFPDARYFGFYQFTLPTLMLRDPELIKQITVKDFDHFVDHREFISEDAEPLWGRNLLASRGQRWRDLRSTLSPAFTSSKMKYMFSLISDSGNRFVQHFLKKNQDLITVEMRDTFSRFANDVIANTAFGSECDSLADPNNEFFLMGKDLTDFNSFGKMVLIFGFLLFPKLCSYFKVTLFSKQVAHFFRHLVKTNIDSREKHGIVRPDMLNLLMQARKTGLKYEESELDTGFATVQESEVHKSSKGHKLQITVEDITAQALLFFFGGFDTVSSLMCFMSYELAVNPDIQERLIQEVDDTLAACNGKVTYEALLGMKYMDMVISETLRKWPNGIFLDRVCTKPYTIEPKTADERPLHLDEKTVVMISVIGLHRDPQYWPDPERFDPERFNEVNKVNIEPYTYLPFGSGPRNCIGSRFALLETKTLFFNVLSHFTIAPVEQTQIPLKISRKQINITAENGFWLGLKRRVKS